MTWNIHCYFWRVLLKSVQWLWDILLTDKTCTHTPHIRQPFSFLWQAINKCECYFSISLFCWNYTKWRLFHKCSEYCMYLLIYHYLLFCLEKKEVWIEIFQRKQQRVRRWAPAVWFVECVFSTCEPVCAWKQHHSTPQFYHPGQKNPPWYTATASLMLPREIFLNVFNPFVILIVEIPRAMHFKDPPAVPNVFLALSV